MGEVECVERKGKMLEGLGRCGSMGELMCGGWRWGEEEEVGKKGWPMAHAGLLPTCFPW